MTDVSLPAGGIPQHRGLRKTGMVQTRSAAEVLAVAFLFSIMLGQIAKVPLISTQTKTAPILLSDLIAAGLCLWLVASILVAGRIRLDRVSVLLAGFVAVNTLAIAVSAVRYELTPSEIAFSSLYLARWTVYASLYLFALSALKTRSAPGLVRVALGVCGAFASFGILQAIFLPNFAFIIYPDAIPYIDWDVQGHRLVSTFLDPNFAGAFILFGLLFIHASGAARGRQSYSLLALFWLALILTLSRSSIIAALVGTSLLTFRTGNFRRLFIPLASFALVATLAGSRLIEFAAQYNKLTFADASALSRLVSWLLAWRIFTDNPVIGIGYNTFGFVRRLYGATAAGSAAFGSDGGLLYMAAISGVVGLALLGTVLWRLTTTGLRTYRTETLPSSVRVLGLTLHAWIPSLVVQSAASNSIFYPFIIGPLFLLGGLCARQYYESAATGGPGAGG